jgi:hypothetical protein
VNRYIALRLCAVLVVLSLAAPPPAARAVDIRVDLSTLVGVTPGNWNNLSNLIGLTPNLIDFPTGVPTPVSIDGTGSPWQAFFGDDNGTFPNRDWLIQPATKDGAGLQSDLSGSYVLRNLTAPSYRIEIVSARTTHPYLNTFRANGALANRTSLGTAVNTPWNSNTDGLLSGNWLIWDNVVPVAGAITISDTAGPGTLGILNALRITDIPEPASAALALTGAFTLTAARPRRRPRR